MDLKPDQRRQATASVRGFAYQIYQSILAWLQCTPTEEIRCEFAEDIDKIKRDLNGEIEEAELNQVKHESPNVTLSSPAATSLINNFFEHQERNSSIKVKVRLCTISERGQEAQAHWQIALCGMDLWDKLKTQELDEETRIDSILNLKSFLEAKDSISDKTKAFLKSSNNSTFQTEFIDRISWDTGQLPYDKIEQEIRDLLSARPRPITDSLEAQQIIDRLYRHIVDLISTDGIRILRNNELEDILSQETSVQIDRRIFQNFSTDVSSIGQRLESIEEGMARIFTSLAPPDIQQSASIQINQSQLILNTGLPPLPKICSKRFAVLEELQSKIKNSQILWVYGSTGYGKTTVANLLVRNFNASCLWFRLRGIVEFELTAALYKIMRQVEESLASQSMIVLDDFTCSQNDLYQFELLQKIGTLSQKNNSLILVTSQYSAPSRLISLFEDQIVKYDLPEITLADINLLLSAVGLVDETQCEAWAKIIHSRTQGHPQLVSAWVTYSKEVNWELSASTLTSNPQAADEIQKESRQQLANSIPFEDARELAKRLSIVKIAFPRDFAIYVGNAQPPLKEAGRAFDSLCGPWIEQIDSNTFSLSPLLDGYAESEFGAEGLSNFRRITAYSWYRQKKLTPIQFLQLILDAFAAKEEFLIGMTTKYLLSMSRESLKLISKNLWHLPLLALNVNSVLDEFNPVTRILFRQAQLKVARNNNQKDIHFMISSLIIKELETKEEDTTLNILLLNFYMESCLYQDSFVDTKEQINRAIKVIEMVKGGSVDPRFLEPIISIGSLEALVMFATSTLNKFDDLDYLFEKLDTQTSEVIQGIFSVFNEYQTALLLLMDRVWLGESQRQSPDWTRCIALYSKILVFAKRHKLLLLFDVASRAQMIIYDEYLDDSHTALQIADAARQTITNGAHPAIDLAESTVIFRSEEPSPALDLIDSVESSLQLEQLTLERIFAIRRAIKFSGENQDWPRVMGFILRGFELSESLPNSPLKQVAIIGFHAEQGWVNHEQGDIASAADEFEKVLKHLELFPDPSHTLFHILRLRFGHMLAWVAHFLSPRSTGGYEQTQTYNRPFCGMFANLEDPPSEGISRQATPLV